MSLKKIELWGIIMEEFICPNCGNRSMTKKVTEENTYHLICSSCGFQYETMPLEDDWRVFA